MSTYIYIHRGVHKSTHATVLQYAIPVTNARHDTFVLWLSLSSELISSGRVKSKSITVSYIIYLLDTEEAP